MAYKDNLISYLKTKLDLIDKERSIFQAALNDVVTKASLKDILNFKKMKNENKLNS